MNKLKLIKFGKCLLPFISECFVFFSALNILKLKLYMFMILLAVLYGCEIWSLTLRTESIWEDGGKENIWI